MGEPVVRRPSSETGTRNGVKQKTEADPSSIMAENSYLISKMPERETGLPNTYDQGLRRVIPSRVAQACSARLSDLAAANRVS